MLICSRSGQEASRRIIESVEAATSISTIHGDKYWSFISQAKCLCLLTKLELEIIQKQDDDIDKESLAEIIVASESEWDIKTRANG